MNGQNSQSGRNLVSKEKSKDVLAEYPALGIVSERYMATMTYDDGTTEETTRDGIRALNDHNRQGTFMSKTYADKVIAAYDALPAGIKVALNSLSPSSRRRIASLIASDFKGGLSDSDLQSLESRVESTPTVVSTRDSAGELLKAAQTVADSAYDKFQGGAQAAMQQGDVASALYLITRAVEVQNVQKGYRAVLSKATEAIISHKPLEAAVTAYAPGKIN